MPLVAFRPEITGLFILPIFAACGGGALSYSGDTRRPVIAPALLASGDEAPAGLQRLGHVSAGCKLADADDGFEGVRASDLACSPAFLRGALRERAAKVGGTFLVDPECEPGGDVLPRGTRRASCSADVWGPRAPSQDAAPAEPARDWPATSLAAPFRDVDEAWRALVDYWPAPGTAPRSPLAQGQVSEVDFPRVGFVRLGDARARADGRCSVDTLRAALRAAAARVGASSVVDVRCVATDEAPFCVASLAGPEVIEPTLAEAR